MPKSNKIISALTAGALIISAVPFVSPVFAADAGENQVYISSADELTEFSKNCRLDSWSKGKTVILTSDINLTDSDFEPIPIFSGAFDGAGHTIKGLRIDEVGSDKGLFRYVETGATIKDLNVQAIISPGGSACRLGGIIGDNSGIVRNCTFFGTIRGEGEIGGIVGHNGETGSVIGCSSQGFIYGKTAVGGIAGHNSGVLLKCENSAGINLTNSDTSVNFAEIDPEGVLDQYRFSEEKNETELLDNCSDSGGIVGYSDGIVQSCINKGSVGYPHVGYNMGGVAGRQSGYLAGCSNFGKVNGRKDVGGIVGQSEPFLTIEPKKATLEQIRAELRRLNDMIGKTLNDVQATGDNVSDRLSVMKEYTDTAEESCKEMLDGVSGFVDGNVGIINTMSVDITNALDKIAPAMDELAEAGKSMSQASENLGAAAEGLKDVADVSDLAMKDIKSSLERLKNASDKLVGASENMKKAAEVLTEDIMWDLEELLYLAYNDMHNASQELNDYLNEIIKALNDFTGALNEAGITEFYPTAVNAFSDELTLTANEGENGLSGESASPLPPAENGEPNEGEETENGGSEVPGFPDEPGENAGGDNSGEGENPGDSGNTDNDDNTANPDNPENPGITENPDNPGSPENPENPENPDNPDNPDNPGDTDKPDKPGLPSLPEPPEIPPAPDISISTEDYERIIDNLTYSRDIMGEAMKNASDSFGAAAEGLRDAFSDLEMAAEKLDPVSDDINDALDKFSEAADAVSLMGKTLQNAFDAFGDAVKGLTENGPKEFKILGEDFKKSGDTLHESVIAVMDNAQRLNEELDQNGGIVADDLREINAQMELISELVLNAVSDLKEDVYSPSVGDTLQDTSEEGISETRQGKVTDCVNRGEVMGDRNVGGIVGALGIEFDLDPESDLTEDMSFGATYETKAVIQTGRNYGSVTAKKDCVGGIAGQMEMGTAIYCQNYGNVTSSGGNYVGGIAGRSESTVRNCYAKSVLSGGSYIGGIAGWAANLRSCCAIATVKEGTEYIGAVSGSVKTDGVLNGNVFIDTGIAGVDGISYAGKAEPIAFSDLVKKEGLPSELTEFKLILTADEKTVETIPFSYGDDLSRVTLPEVPEKSGYFGKWGEFDTSGVMSDITLEAVYSPWITIAASREEEGKLALALAEGQFTDSALLHAAEGTAQPPKGTEGARVLNISLTGTEPGDNGTVPLRLLNTVGKNASVLRLEGDNWVKTEHTENGSYLITEMKGTEGTFCICPGGGNAAAAVITAASAAAGATAVIIVAIVMRKKKAAAKNEVSAPKAKEKGKSK